MRMKKNNYIDIDVIGLSDLEVNGCKEFSYGEGDWTLRGFVIYHKQYYFCVSQSIPTCRSSAQLAG